MGVSGTASIELENTPITLDQPSFTAWIIHECSEVADYLIVLVCSPLALDVVEGEIIFSWHCILHVVKRSPVQLIRR